MLAVFDVGVSPVATIAGGLSAAGAIVVGLRWLFARRLRTKVGHELATYKDQVMQLSARLDTLKERHKMLTFTDHDYKVPMTGQTKAAYENISARLDQFRERWLALMDAWQQAEDLVSAEKSFGTAKSRAARQTILTAGAPAELQAVERDCGNVLDQLETAHETSAANSRAFAASRDGLQPRLESIAAARLPAAPYQTEIEAASILAAQADACREADPLAAVAMVAEGQAKLDALHARLQTIIEHVRAASDALAKAQSSQALVAQRRAEGFLLTEPEGNPDSPLAAAFRSHEDLWEAMRKGDVESAAQRLRQSFEAAEQARQTVDRQVEARAYCDRELPLRRVESRRLADRCVQVREDAAALEREFATESWRNVADNFRHTESLAKQYDRRLREAESCAEPSRQHYLTARRELEALTAEQQQADRLLEGVGTRLAELERLRTACQAQITELRGYVSRVRQLIESHAADRPRAQQRLQGATQALDAAANEGRQPRANWERISQRLSEVKAELTAAEQQAQEDIRLAGQAASQIADAEREIRQAAAFRENGLSADVSGAESQLAQAAARRGAQDYEQAIALAQSAQQSARQALADAQRRAQITSVPR